MHTLSLKFSVSGHFKLSNFVTDRDVGKYIKHDAELMIYGYLSQYDLDTESLGFTYNEDEPPFVFRTRTEHGMPDNKSLDGFQEDVYYDDNILVDIPFRSKVELNRFKIMHEHHHKHFNGEEIRINL